MDEACKRKNLPQVERLLAPEVLALARDRGEGFPAGRALGHEFLGEAVGVFLFILAPLLILAPTPLLLFLILILQFLKTVMTAPSLMLKRGHGVVLAVPIFAVGLQVLLVVFVVRI